MSNRSKRQSSKTMETNTVSADTTGWTPKLAVETFFNQYFLAQDQVASMEGICHFAENFFQIDPDTDLRILVFLWRMIQGPPMRSPSTTLKKSSSLTKATPKPSSVLAHSTNTTASEILPGHFTLEQFSKGCSRYGIDTETSLHKLLPALDTGFLEKTDFREFFKFCFQFHRQGTHRTLEKDLVVTLVPIILQDRVPSHRTRSFGEFLSSSKDTAYDKITLDQWTSFLDFCTEYDNVSNFDADGSAWPTLIDDYVAFCVTQRYD